MEARKIVAGSSAPGFLIFGLGCLLVVSQGCVPAMDDRWLVVEIQRTYGVRLHDAREARFIVGGDPKWEHKWSRRGKTRPKWAIPAFELDPSYPWPGVFSGDLSKHGELALARRATYSGATQILDIRNGHIIAHISVCPLAVGWSNDGSTLAVLEWLDPARRPRWALPRMDSVQVALYDRGGHKITAWPLEFEPSKLPRGGYWRSNRFVISWSRNDSWLLVSTKKALRNRMLPKLYLIEPQSGPVDVGAVSDAYFLGSSRFVGNEHGKWSAASFFEVNGGDIQKERPVGRKLFVAGSSAEEGVFLAYMPPGWFPMLRFALPVVLMDAEGKLVAKDMTGYSYGASLRVIRSDSPLAEVLRTLLETEATVPTAYEEGRSRAGRRRLNIILGWDGDCGRPALSRAGDGSECRTSFASESVPHA